MCMKHRRWHPSRSTKRECKRKVPGRIDQGRPGTGEFVGSVSRNGVSGTVRQESGKEGQIFHLVVHMSNVKTGTRNPGGVLPDITSSSGKSRSWFWDTRKRKWDDHSPSIDQLRGRHHSSPVYTLHSEKPWIQTRKGTVEWDPHYAPTP